MAELKTFEDSFKAAIAKTVPASDAPEGATVTEETDTVETETDETVDSTEDTDTEDSEVDENAETDEDETEDEDGEAETETEAVVLDEDQLVKIGDREGTVKELLQFQA